MNVTELRQASVYSYLPYLGFAWNLEERTVNSDRLRTYRRRKYALEELIAHLKSPDVEKYLWRAVKTFEKYPFTSMKGFQFSYTVKHSKTGLSAAEIEINRKEKTITKSTINMAFCKALELQNRQGYVSDPKQIDSFGASYLYPMFLRFEIIQQMPMV